MLAEFKDLTATLMSWFDKVAGLQSGTAASVDMSKLSAPIDGATSNAFTAGPSGITMGQNMAYKAAYDELAAHDRLAKTVSRGRASYYAEAATEASEAKTRLSYKVSMLTSLSNFKTTQE